MWIHLQLRPNLLFSSSVNRSTYEDRKTSRRMQFFFFAISCFWWTLVIPNLSKLNLSRYVLNASSISIIHAPCIPFVNFCCWIDESAHGAVECFATWVSKSDICSMTTVKTICFATRTWVLCLLKLYLHSLRKIFLHLLAPLFYCWRRCSLLPLQCIVRINAAWLHLITYT